MSCRDSRPALSLSQANSTVQCVVALSAVDHDCWSRPGTRRNANIRLDPQRGLQSGKLFHHEEQAAVIAVSGVGAMHNYATARALSSHCIVRQSHWGAAIERLFYRF